MRGSFIYQRKRDKGSERWSLVLDRGDHVDPKSGKLKRRQQWFPFKGTKQEAEDKLIELLNDKNKNTLIEPSKITFGEWLLTWVEKFTLRLRTYRHLQRRDQEPSGSGARRLPAAGTETLPPRSVLS